MKQKTTMKFMGAAAALCLTLASGTLLLSGNETNVYADDPPMTVTDGASVKYMDTAQQSGMRFNFSLTETAYNEAYDEDGNFKTGMATGALLIPKSMLEGDLNHEAKTTNDKIVEVQFGETENSEWTQSASGNYTNYVYVYDFPESAYNTDVSVVGYYKSGDEYTYTSVVTRSMAYVANEAIKTDLSPEQKAILDSYLINYNVTVKTSDEDAGTTYSVKYGKKLSEAEGYADPEKGEEYFFGGFKSANDGNTYAASGYTVRGEDTLTAQWQKYKPDSFNTLVEGTLNEYMLADFTSTAYSHLLSTKGNSASYSLNGLLEITSSESYWSERIVYTFPESISMSDIEAINVYTAGVDGVSFGSYIMIDGVLQYVKDLWGTGKFTNNSLTGTTATSFEFTSTKGAKISKITYTKKAKTPDSFNKPIAEGSNEYMLADFTSSTDYNGMISTSGSVTCTWGNSLLTMKFTAGGAQCEVLLYEPIAKADISKLKIYADNSSNTVCVGVKLDNGEKQWLADKQGGVEKLDISSKTGTNVTSIVFWSGGATYKLLKITYEKTLASFNTLIEGTENEYLLADFKDASYQCYVSNVYRDWLTEKHIPTFTFGENGLTYTDTSWGNEYVLYTLPETLNVSDVAKLTVNNGNKFFYFITSDGKNNYVVPGHDTYDCAKVIEGLSSDLKITGIVLSCEIYTDSGTTTTITYTKNVTTAE